jgi:hypothetical protein
MATDSGYHALLQPLLIKEQKLSSELDAVRAAIKALRTAAEADVPTGPAFPVENEPDTPTANPLFDGMTLAEMTHKTIQMAGRTLVARGILEIWREHGVAPRDKGALQKVQIALNRRATQFNDIVHVGDGKWGLSEWYTQSELDGMSDKIDGANARDRAEHSKRTKAGIEALKARGGTIGKKHFVKDYPLRLERARELADVMRSGKITGKEFVAEMHKVQPEPLIKSVQSFYNWKRMGFEGLTAEAPLADVANVRFMKK